MSRPAFPPVPFFAALAVLVIYAAVCLLIRMAEYGPDIGWDSVHYISVARSLLEGKGFLAADGDRFAAWAPLYPMLLAAIGALASVDPREAIGPLNAVLLGLCILAAGAWMRRTLDSPFPVVWGCLAVALSSHLTLAASQALSETTFVLFATLALARMDRHLSGGGRSSLVWAAIFVGLAWATRYVGVVVVIAAIAALALRRGVAPWDKAKEIVLFSLISAAPVGAWLLRNLVVTGRLVPPGLTTDYTWREAAEGVAGATGRLLTVPETRWEPWSTFEITLGGLSLLALTAALVVSAARAVRGQSDIGRSFHLFGGFVILYCCFYAWTTVEGNTWHGVQQRHLLPVYMPLLFSALSVADRFLGSPIRALQRRRAAGLTLAGALAAWFAWTAPAHFVGSLKGEGQERGYAFFYRDSEIMRWLRENPPLANTVLYGNDVYAVYIEGTDRAGAYRHMPGNRPIGRTVGDSNSDDMLQVFLKHAENGALVAWLFGEYQNLLFDYDAADMRTRAGLRLVADLADGAVFEVDRTYGGGGGEWREAALAAEPAIDAFFDVHVQENRLIYVRESCARADSMAKFFLHVFPVDDRDLPDDRKSLGFMDLDFDFQRLGARFHETCVAVAPLPDWEIARFLTGQSAGRDRLWETAVLLEAAEEFQSAANAAGPAVAAFFDVHVRENRLTYVRKPCVRTDTRARFFLHVFPIDEKDLPDDRRRHGFVGLDFDFERRGARFGGACVAIVPLPEWRVARVVTGQFSDSHRRWEAEISLAEVKSVHTTDLESIR